MRCVNTPKPIREREHARARLHTVRFKRVGDEQKLVRWTKLSQSLRITAAQCVRSTLLLLLLWS